MTETCHTSLLQCFVSVRAFCFLVEWSAATLYREPGGLAKRTQVVLAFAGGLKITHREHLSWQKSWKLRGVAELDEDGADKVRYAYSMRMGTFVHPFARSTWIILEWWVVTLERRMHRVRT